VAIPIPTQLPDGATPVQTRRDTQPVAPVAPVGGVAEEIAKLESREVLKWTPPVLDNRQAHLARPSLEALQQLVQQGLGRFGVSQSAGAQDLNGIPLAALLLQVAQRAAQQPSRLAWPLPDTKAQSIPQAWLSWYRALAGSDLFSAQRLFQAWFRPGAQSLQDPLPLERLARWANSISAESETTQQALRMLLSGEMSFQAELVPGLPIAVHRHDAWRENSSEPGKVDKGAQLSIELKLPRLGDLKIEAAQWQQDIRIRIIPSRTAEPELTAKLKDLQTRLSGFAGDRIELVLSLEAQEQ
jgi:hypothetical protein